MDIAAALALGFVLDAIFGDPRSLPHPVRLIGLMISRGEALLRKMCGGTDRRLFIGGAVLTVLVTALSALAPYLILNAAGTVSEPLRTIISAIFCWQALAARSLRDESMIVHKHLTEGDLKGARERLAYIVGRDTDRLDEQDIARAAVETVAENASDGVIAPMLCFALGGAPFAFFYKAVNTLDSMIGYKNDKYMYFGRFAAKLDDVMNYIPAVITAYVMMLAAFILRYDYKSAYAVYRRDRRNHSSPNSGKPESACAGALNIRLGGDNYYSGRLVKKPTIGDAVRAVEPGDIKAANRVMAASAVIILIICLSARLAVAIL